MKIKLLLSSLLVLLALLAGGFALGEWRGWPWLAAPVSQLLSDRLGREVQLLPTLRDGAQTWRLRLLGGVKVQAGRLLIDGPSWRAGVPTLEAERVELQLRYSDLWDWRGSGTLQVRLLQAATIKADLWRDGHGRATWALSSAAGKAANAGPLRFERLLLGGGHVELHDEVQQLVASIDFALGDRGGQLGSLFAMAHGRYRDQPLRAWLDSAAPLPLLGLADAGAAAPLRLQLRSAEVSLDFDGQLRELNALQGLNGLFKLSGPSLAAIGDALGVTLPTTARFDASGRLSREGADWQVDIGRAQLGRSRLDGRFLFAAGGPRPKLSGRLGGEVLWFADLGPTIGVPVQVSQQRPVSTRGKVLPEREFDLPALRAMDADVAVALRKVDLGGLFAEPIAPLHGRLLLQDGVLSLRELDARTARGRLGGTISLDGRAETALWRADLDWSGVALERWLKQGRSKSQPPYVSGLLHGRLNLSGQGRSTAELLATAQGRVLAFLPKGKISHLAVEAVGIDLAQGLGILLRGDDALVLNCAVADLRVAKGQVQPNTLLVDTADSTLWMEGSLSLASERLDLRLQVAPKDFSPLSLRTPVQIGGSLTQPTVSLQAAPLIRRLVPAALLAMLNPLAGLLPLIDSGSTDANREMLASCQRLLARRPR